MSLRNIKMAPKPFTAGGRFKNPEGRASNNRLKPLLAIFFKILSEVYLQNVKHPSDSSKKNLYSLRFSKKKIQPRKWFVAIVNKY